MIEKLKILNSKLYPDLFVVSNKFPIFNVMLNI